MFILSKVSGVQITVLIQYQAFTMWIVSITREIANVTVTIYEGDALNSLFTDNFKPNHMGSSEFHRS